MRTDYQTLKIDIGAEADGIVVVMFNRPAQRNAISRAMTEEIRAALTELGDDPTTRAVIFTGVDEKAFIGGADIAELKERGKLDAFRRVNANLFRAVEQFPWPTIAAVRGFALGGGCEFAMACDLRVAGASARFGQPEVGLGIIPGAGGTYRLPKLVGLGRARELVLTGRIIDAAEALSIGLVNRVAPDADVLDAALLLARETTQHSALAVRLAKAALNLGTEISTDAALTLESALQATLFDDPEKHARMGEFLARRAAQKKERKPS